MSWEERYSRQIQLAGFGPEKQKKLSESKVLVIGAGGLGIPVLQYLAAMGVGKLGIVDQDVVNESNLHRQVLYTREDIGKRKVDCCVRQLQKQNPGIQIKGYSVFFQPENALEILQNYDLLIDATDNFSTRYLINDACVILNKPFIYGAIQSFEGHVSVFNYQDGPTYRCLYPNPPLAGQVPDCNQAGVLGIVPGLIGSKQALEAVKIITEIGKPLSGMLEVTDFLNNSTYTIRLKRKEKNTTIQRLDGNYEGIPCQVSQNISPSELENRLRENTGQFQIIDVRESHEFELEHLENAVSLPLSTLSMTKIDLSSQLPAIVVCQLGARSGKAISYLQQKLPDVQWINLEGGLDNFKSLCGTQYFKKYDFS